MFKLYTNLGSVGQWKLIDVAITEKEIVQTILYYSNKCHSCNYTITKTKNSSNVVVKQIIGEYELKQYLTDFKERNTIKPLNDMSCIELKRLILEKQNSLK